MYTIQYASFFLSKEPDRFGIPLFSRGLSNIMFVAETDNYSKITRFVPFFDSDKVENYEVVSAREYREGDNSPIVSKTAKSGLLCEYIEYYLAKLKVGDFIGSPAFQIHLARIHGTSNSDFVALRRDVASIIFGTPAREKIWTYVEEQSGFDEREFWEKFQSHKEKQSDVILREAGLSDFAEALDWLRARSTYHLPRWPDVWRIVRSVSPFSEELALISADWVSSMASIDNRLEVILEVTRHILHSTLSEKEIFVIGDRLVEILESRPDTMFYIADSPVSMRRLERMLENYPQLRSRVEATADLRWRRR